MELKSVTVQLKVRGRDETHELTWDNKAKAYVSASGTVKVKDPKAKKIEVQVRERVIDKWVTFKGPCNAAAGSEAICKIDNKNRNQQIKQITVRFAPTAKAAETRRSFFADYIYTPQELKTNVTEWVGMKVEDGELPAPAKKHIDALSKQMKGFTVKLTKDELWAQLSTYEQLQGPTLAKQKPLFKLVPRKPIPIVILKPKAAKAAKPEKPSKMVADATAAMTDLNRTIQRLKTLKSPTLANLKKVYQDLNRPEKKIWDALQIFQKNTDPKSVAIAKDLKEARQRYNQACQDVLRLVQQKADASVSSLEVARKRLERLAEKGSASALQQTKRAFNSQYEAARKNIATASTILILPGEKPDHVSARILDRQKGLEAIHKAGLAIQVAAKPSAVPDAREAGSSSAQPPVIRKAHQTLARLKQTLAFLPDREFGDDAPYDKSKMDRLYHSGKLSRLSHFAAQVKTASDEINAIGLGLLNANPSIRLSLNTLADKINAAQAYLIREHIDTNPVMANKYPAAGAASNASYAWLENANQRTDAVNKARALIKSLSALFGPSNAKDAKGLKWSYDMLMTSHTSKYGYAYKEAWERAKNVLTASYNYQMYKRLPQSVRAEAGRPAAPERAIPLSPAVAPYIQRAEAAAKLVDDVYYQLFKHNPTSPFTGDKPARSIYADQVAKIPRDIAKARQAIADLNDVDDRTYNAAPADERKRIDAARGGLIDAHAKLTKAQNRYEALKGSAQERPELSREEKAIIQKAQQDYAQTRGRLQLALRKVDATYREFFDSADKPKQRSLLPKQIAMYETRVLEEDSKLDVSLGEETRRKISDSAQREWDELQVKRAEARNKLGAVSDRLAELRRTAPVAKPPPQKAAAAPVARPPEAAQPAAPEAPKSAAELLEDVQRLRGLATAAATLTDAATHRDSLIRIVEEAQRRGLTALEGSARRSLKRANERVVELGGAAKEPQSTSPRAVEPAKPAARVAEPAQPPRATAPEPAPAVEPPASPKPSAADVAAERRAAAEAKAREAAAAKAEAQAKQESATRETTQLKENYGIIEAKINKLQAPDNSSSFADKLKALGDYEKEVQSAIDKLRGHVAVIGTYAQGVQNRYDALLKRIPALRMAIESDEKKSALQTEVSGLQAKAAALMQEGEAILGKPEVDPADVPKLQSLVQNLSEVEASLNKIFGGLSKEQDSLKTRIAAMLGNIREVSGRMSDRIQIVTSLAQKNKPALFESLNSEAEKLIQNSSKLRKQGARAANALRPVGKRLGEIEKALDALGKTEKDPLKKQIVESQIKILEEVSLIEKITGPLQPKLAKPAEKAPLPDVSLPRDVTSPTAEAKPVEVKPPPPPTPAAEAKLGEIRGRAAELRLKVDQFSTELSNNPDLASEETCNGFLRDLKVVNQDLKSLTALSSDESVASDAISLKSSLESLKNGIIDNAAFVLKLAINSPSMRAMKLEARLSKLQDFVKKLDELKVQTNDATALQTIAASRAVIQEQVDSLLSKRDGEPIANIVGRLNGLDYFRNKVRQSTDGRGIVFENVSKDKFKSPATLVDLFRALKPMDSDTPERAVVAATVQVYPNELMQERMPFMTLFSGRNIKDVVAIADPSVGQAQVTVTLFFDKTAVDAQRKAAIAGAEKVVADRKKEGETLELRRLEPLQGVNALARTNGGKAIEVTVPFAVEGKLPVNNRFYGSRITVSSAADVLSYVDRVRNQMGLDANEMVMIAVGSPDIAKALQGNLSADTRDKAVFLAKGLPANAMVLITRSAYSNDSYKGKEYPFDPLKPSGQNFNVSVGDWAKASPSYGVFYPVMQKLGLAPKAIERLNPQVARKAAAEPAPLGRPVAERQFSGSGSPATAPAPAQTGPIKLPAVYNTVQVADKFLPSQFGLKRSQAAVYQSKVSTQDLENPEKLTQRIANIRGHAMSLGMDHVLVIYRGVTKAGRDHYNQFVELVKKSDPELKFLHVTRIEGSSLADGADDEVHFVLLRDASVSDEQIAAAQKKFLKKQMEESH